MGRKEVVPKIARWALTLAEFEYDIEHRPGQRMRHVDALSRNPQIMLIEEDTLLHRIQAAQQKDEGIKAIVEVLKYDEFEDYFSERGVLFKYKDGLKLIVVPKRMQAALIKQVHEKGHFGLKKLEEVICREYYVPNLRKKIIDCISNCIPCILTAKRGRKEGFLHSIPKENLPLETYHVDHLGPMTTTKKGYRYMLTIVDAFSKFVWIFPTKTTTTSETLKKLKLHQMTFGNPSRMITDRGTAFTSAAFSDYCNSENIEHVRTTTGIPRGNGQVERIHSIVIAILTKLSLTSENMWYKNVSRVQRWINGSYQRSIKTTPFELMFGTRMKNTDDVEMINLIDEEMRLAFQGERDERRQAAAEQIQKVQEENQRDFNKGRKAPTIYKVGDLVAIKRTQFGPCLKISPAYLGPYLVKKVKDNERYDLQKVGEHEGPKVTSSAADHMKPFTDLQSSDSEDEEYEKASEGNDPKASSNYVINEEKPYHTTK